MSQSVTSLNSLMQYALPKEGLVTLAPASVKLYKMLEKKQLKESEMTAGRKLLVAVESNAPGGATFGDGSSFAYNAVVDATYPEAQLDCMPVVLGAQLSNSAIDRLAKNRIQGISVASMKTKSLYNELSKIAEIACFYGQSAKGVGTVGAITGTSGTSLVVTFTAGQFAPGIWGGRKGHPFEVRQTGTGTARAGTTAAKPLVISAVNFTARTVTFTGDATEIATVVATDVLYPFGAWANDMKGLDSILTTDGSVFGIDNTVHELWKGSRYTLSSLAFSELIKGVGVGVSIGGLADDVIVFINSDKYESLNSTVTNQNYRNSGASSNDKVKIGSSSMTFTTQAGEATLVGSPLIKEADGFAFNLNDLDVFGAKKISFQNADGKGEYWVELPGNYGARMQAAYEFAIMLQHPAQAIKLTIP